MAKIAPIAGKVDAASQTAEDSTVAATQHPTAPAPGYLTGTLDLSSPLRVIVVNPAPGLAVATYIPPGDNDDNIDSDLDSVVSDVSSGAVEEWIERDKQKKIQEALNKPPPCKLPKEEGGLESGIWNPVVVLRLRIYSKESGVSIKVVKEDDTAKGSKQLKTQQEGKKCQNRGENGVNSAPAGW
jgi:hypothetical protein